VRPRRRAITAAFRSPEPEAQARLTTDRLALLAAVAALARSAPADVAEAYASTRLATPRRVLGANDLGAVAEALLRRALDPLTAKLI